MTTKEHTVRAVLYELKASLAAVSEDPSLEAQVLLGHVLNRPKAWLYAHPDEVITPDEEAALDQAVESRKLGTPLPYVIGHWEFFGLDFKVTPDTLIPRPETELLVETALDWLRIHPQRRLALDVGTGSGCIAISLAAQVYDLRVFANDVSFEALEVARDNSVQHAVETQVSFFQSDLAGCLKASFDLICANLPYIPTGTLEKLPIFGREPTQALDGGTDGLDVIRRFLLDAPILLAPGGLLLFEIEAGQGENAHRLAAETFPRSAVQVLPDLSGLDRLIIVERSL